LATLTPVWKFIFAEWLKKCSVALAQIEDHYKWEFMLQFGSLLGIFSVRARQNSKP
jgi:hypothetical protein